ncbi:MAG: ribosomal protein S18-alanine N-acetyltransferase [Gammaproteobacteria bacterium]
MIAVVRDFPPTIRPMRQADVSAVAAIENSTYDFPWSAGIFRDCLLAGYTNVVLDRAGEIVGYGIMSIAAAEAHLLNICVTRELRRRGIGRNLLTYLLRRARNCRARRMYLEVRPSNDQAMGLYSRMGFEVLGVREGYYRAHDGNEDAVVLVRHFDDGRDDS